MKKIINKDKIKADLDVINLILVVYINLSNNNYIYKWSETLLTSNYTVFLFKDYELYRQIYDLIKSKDKANLIIALELISKKLNEVLT